MASPKLETFPAEVKLLVLQEVPDLDTLLSLIVASRTYNKIYKTYRETVLRPVILNGIANLKIFYYQPIAWMELCIYRRNRWASGDHLENAFQRFYEQRKQGQGKEWYMTYEQCIPLCAIKDGRTWNNTPLGQHVIHPGGPIFRSRRRVSLQDCWDKKKHQIRFVSIEGAVPTHVRWEGDGPLNAW